MYKENIFGGLLLLKKKVREILYVEWKKKFKKFLIEICKYLVTIFAGNTNITPSASHRFSRRSYSNIVAVSLHINHPSFQLETI